MAIFGDLDLLIYTMLFGLIVVASAVYVAERWGKEWAPIWIVGFLIGLSILFDYGGVKQTELEFLGATLLFAAGPMLWPILAVGQDYLNEFYGPKIAYNYVIGMFMAKVGVALGTLWIIYRLPVPTDPALEEAALSFNTLLGAAPRISIASIIAVVAAFTVNAWMYDRLRKRTSGRHLWLRNNVSSAVALTVDAFIFFYAGFWGVLPPSVVWSITLSYIGICYLTVFLDTGFLYGLVALKRRGLLGLQPASTDQRLVIEPLERPVAVSDAST